MKRDDEMTTTGPMPTRHARRTVASGLRRAALTLAITSPVGGCTFAAGGADAGSLIFVVGLGLLYVGMKLATRTNLERWTKTVLKAGAVVVILG